MYDFPELGRGHQQFWSALVARLEAAGIAYLPRRLTHGLSCRATWAHPGLIFGQACEYPLAKSFREYLQILATPRYGAPGCSGAAYRSAIVVRADEPADSLEELRQRRCVVNEPDSNSGMNLFRAALAPVSGGGRFFASVQLSGSHQRSLELVAAGEGDVTAVDCVTFAHVQKLRPQLAGQLRVIDWTPPSPCLPFVTSRRTSEVTVLALRAALADVFADRDLAPVRDQLLLSGVDLLPDEKLTRVTDLEIQAEQWGYPALL
jgi:ABC-type phosphate/phosphonate transport system substrate-binding protein